MFWELLLSLPDQNDLYLLYLILYFGISWFISQLVDGPFIVGVCLKSNRACLLSQ